MPESRFPLGSTGTGPSGSDILHLQVNLRHGTKRAHFQLERGFTSSTFPKSQADLLNAVQADHGFKALMSIFGFKFWGLRLYKVDTGAPKMFAGAEYANVAARLTAGGVNVLAVYFKVVKVRPPPGLVAQVHEAIFPAGGQSDEALLRYIKGLTRRDYKPVGLRIQVKVTTTGDRANFICGVKINAAKWPALKELIGIITTDEEFLGFMKNVEDVTEVRVEEVFVDGKLVRDDAALALVANSVVRQDKEVLQVKLVVVVRRSPRLMIAIGLWNIAWAMVSVWILIWKVILPG